MSETDLESDKKLDELYQQLPRPAVPESIRANLFALAQQQAQANQKNHQEQHKGGLTRWFQNMFLGAPVYAWSGVAMCVLTLGIIVIPTENNSVATDNTLFMASKAPHTNTAETTANLPTNTQTTDNSTDWQIAKVEPATTLKSEDNVQEEDKNPQLRMSSVPVEPNTEEMKAASVDKNHDQQKIDRQIAKIRLLNQLNNSKAAKQAILDFEQEYPEYSLPQDIQALKKSQP